MHDERNPGAFLWRHHHLSPCGDLAHEDVLRPTTHVLTPTFLEYWAARRLYRPRATWTEVGLTRWTGAAVGSVVIVCGLAGALSADIPSGSVLVPESVGLPDGRQFACDADLVAAFSAAARHLGFAPLGGALLTAPTLVVGPMREEWARRGFIAADMETGLLAEKGLRIATVRVVLDTPLRPLSERWLKPHRAVLQPALWKELRWLARFALPYATRSVDIVRAGLDHLIE